MSCLNSCPGGEGDLQDDCKCGTKVYKQGGAISEEELYKYKVGVGCVSFNAIGTPLARLTALVRFQPPCYYNITCNIQIDLSRLEQQTFLQQNLDPLLEIQMPVPLDNAGKNHVKSLKLPYMKF